MLYVYHVQHKVEALNRSNSNIKALLFNESLTLALFFFVYAVNIVIIILMLWPITDKCWY